MPSSRPQLTNAGDDVVVFYNDKASLAHLLDMMKAARDGVEDHSPLMYHISLVDLLAACAEGKNVYTEIKCTSLLPLEDVVSVVTHEDCITEVGPASTWGRGGRGAATGMQVWGSQAGAAPRSCLGRGRDGLGGGETEGMLAEEPGKVGWKHRQGEPGRGWGWVVGAAGALTSQPCLPR